VRECLILHLHSRINLAALDSLTLLEYVFKPFLPSSPHKFSSHFPPTSPQTDMKCRLSFRDPPS